jgi:hypothetical protein
VKKLVTPYVLITRPLPPGLGFRYNNNMKNWGLILAFSSIMAYADHTVLVVDSPFNPDYYSSNHSKIKNNEFRTTKGTLYSDFNQRRNDAFKKGHKFYVETNSSVDKDFYHSYMRRKNELEGLITHSSQTSSVLANHLDESGSFVVFPIIRYKPVEYGRKDIIELAQKYANGKLDEQQENEINEITHLIEQAETKIVQMSFSTSYSIIQSYYENKYSLSGTFTGKRKKKALYEAMTLNSVNYFKKLFSKNPETLFLLSSGNQGKNTENIKMHLSQNKMNNVLYIGATNLKGIKRDFSNFSNDLVSIGLEDSEYDLLNFKKKSKLMEGTSFTVAKAAALFSNLAHEENINSLEDLKKRFIEKHCNDDGVNFIYRCK